MHEAVLVAGARTPIGRLLGSLGTRSAPALGAVAIRAAVTRAGIDSSAVDAVIMGNVVQAGVGPNPARQAAARAGLPLTVPATTVNKLCLSGLASIAHAAQLVACGQHEVLVAGGMESMTNAPHLVSEARGGLRFGDAALRDSLNRDALVCAFDDVSMGAATERYQESMQISRQEQDSFAAGSHARAAAAMKDGRLADEIAPVTIAGKRGDIVVEHDEGVRPDITSESLAQLRPAFADDGTITAGSASQLSDGACAVVIMRKTRALQLGLTWIAEVGAYGTAAGPDPSLLLQPANAIKDAVRRDGNLRIDDFDLVEINEAFAGVALASMRELGVPAERVNVNGGAIALGHPVGMSGARLPLTLALELGRRGGGLGVAALCGGGGQGDALIIRVPS